MKTPAPALELAVRAHQAGDLPRAEQLCRQILQVDPRHVDALHLLGLVTLQLGRNDLAIDLISQAVHHHPGYAEAHNNLGVALKGVGRIEEALGHYQRAVQLQPDYAEAHSNLGVVLAEQGRLGEALTSFERAVRLKPTNAESHNNLGVVLAEVGRQEEALASYQCALQLRPDYPAAHNNLGSALKAQGRLDEALASCRRALQLRPDYPSAHNNLGTILRAQGRLVEALASFQQAVCLAPAYAEAQNNLGVVLTEQQRPEEALASYQRALQLQPDYAEAHNNLGMLLSQRGSLEEALASSERAVQLKPDYADAHYNLGMLRLLMGRLEQGLPEYEWRWKCKGFSLPSYNQPFWDGSPLGGRTIVLQAEQGLGDTLQFIRYAHLVQQRGGRVVVVGPRTLVRLLASCPGVEVVIAEGAFLPEFDVYAPLMSLPWRFGTTLATVPAQVPYLAADPDLVARWRRELGAVAGFRVGIAWQGNPQHRRDRARSIPLIQFAILARLEGIRLFSLQKGFGRQQLDEPAIDFPVTDLSDQLEDFLDAAAVLKNLDLVITADTATAHLAGALGVPVWVGLPFAPDWRWLLHREDTPWYPTMRLFRQPEPGHWGPVFERMAGELSRRVRSSDGTPSITIEVSPGELIDRIANLEIQGERLTDEAARKGIAVELAALQAARERAIPPLEDLRLLTAELRAVHDLLQQVEDEGRRCERSADFGPRFIELARSVYQYNDRRAALKAQINERLGERAARQPSHPARLSADGPRQGPAIDLGLTHPGGSSLARSGPGP